MPAHTVIRPVEWSIGPDTEPDREPDVYAIECAVCMARSPQEEVPEDAREWIFKHVATHPCHHTYRAIVIRPWRAVMS